MKKQLALRLVESNIISEEQLKLALKRQRQFGGRLGINLLALGYISQEDLSDFLVGYCKQKYCYRSSESGRLSL